MRKIYLAGPEVFLVDAVEQGEAKKALTRTHGFEPLFPLDHEIEARAGEALDRLIYRANMEMIRAADAVICNLTPFRGISADVGTVFELGVAIGRGIPVFAYTNETRPYVSRVFEADEDAHRLDDGTWRDGDGLQIEDFGNSDNLMIDACLAQGGHPLVRVPCRPSQMARDLRGFETCLKAAQAHFA